MEYLHDLSSILHGKIQRIQMEHGGPSLVEYFAGNNSSFCSMARLAAK